ncbi:MAG: hypothetical protein HYR55_08815 [Acidobacteria bacterium]|nr:hypothetical protein [Acidobacteriota bacterium]MBI3655801.1 hypothetical protein [Acidobacteriota bacterium]
MARKQRPWVNADKRRIKRSGCAGWVDSCFAHELCRKIERFPMNNRLVYLLIFFKGLVFTVVTNPKIPLAIPVGPREVRLGSAAFPGSGLVCCFVDFTPESADGMGIDSV